MISVNTRTACSLKISSAHALPLCVGGCFFSFFPQDTCALHNSVFPLKLWMFFQDQTQLLPSWGCFPWHLRPESSPGGGRPPANPTGTRRGADSPATSVPKRGANVKGIRVTRTRRGGRVLPVGAACLPACLSWSCVDMRVSAGLALPGKGGLSWTGCLCLQSTV